MITYDEHLEMMYPPSPFDELSEEEIADQLKNMSLEHIFRAKYNAEPLGSMLVGVLDDLYLALFPEPVLTLLITRALEVYGEDATKEINAALIKFNTKGEKND